MGSRQTRLISSQLVQSNSSASGMACCPVVRFFARSADSALIKRFKGRKVSHYIPFFIHFPSCIDPWSMLKLEYCRVVKSCRFLSTQSIVKVDEVVLIRSFIYLGIGPVPENIRKHKLSSCSILAQCYAAKR